MNKRNFAEVKRAILTEGKIKTPRLVESAMIIWEELDLKLFRIYLNYCERDLTRSEEIQKTVLKRKLVRLGLDLGFEMQFNQDPRGYSSRLIFPSGYSNSFGGNGVVGINWR